jgi:hypothetical protein
VVRGTLQAAEDVIVPCTDPVMFRRTRGVIVLKYVGSDHRGTAAVPEHDTLVKEILVMYRARS